MGRLKEWAEEDWVMIGLDGSILGPCGTGEKKGNPDRCLKRADAKAMSKAARAKTAQKKKRFGRKGQQVVSNTPAGKVTKQYTKR